MNYTTNCIHHENRSRLKAVPNANPHVSYPRSCIFVIMPSIDVIVRISQNYTHWSVYKRSYLTKLCKFVPKQSESMQQQKQTDLQLCKHENHNLQFIAIYSLTIYEKTVRYKHFLPCSTSPPEAVNTGRVVWNSSTSNIRIVLNITWLLVESNWTGLFYANIQSNSSPSSSSKPRSSRSWKRDSSTSTVSPPSGRN